MTNALQIQHTTQNKLLVFPKTHQWLFLYTSAETHRKYFENIAQLEGYNIRYYREKDQALGRLGNDSRT